MAILVFSPNGTHVTKPTLEAARASADCIGKTIVVTSALTAAQSNITAAWPADRSLEVKTGGEINNTTAFTILGSLIMSGGQFGAGNTGAITISGTFSADLYRVFGGVGGSSVVFSSGMIPHPEWFGQVVSSVSPFPYAPAPIESLRGRDYEKFSLALLKSIMFTDYPNFQLNERVKTAFLAGAVNITIVGDSISSGGDNWRVNAYTALLKTKLKQTFPWVSFTINNLAIGGTSTGNLVTDTYVGVLPANFVLGTNFYFPRNNGGINTVTTEPTSVALLDEDWWITGSTVGVTWKQHIVNTSPDIIVYAFGMNDGTDTDAFNTSYQTFQTFITTQMPSKPWFCLVAAFLATKNPPAGQPQATWQIPGQSIADQVKSLAIRDNYGLIDANAVFNILRDGVRHDYTPYLYEGNQRYGSDATAWVFQSGFYFNTADTYFKGTGVALRTVATRDIDFSATFVISAFDVTSNNFVGRISYRSKTNIPAGLSGYSADIIMNSTSTFARAVLYYQSTIVVTVTFNMAALPIVGETFALKVKAYGSRHEVWLGDLLLIDTQDINSCYIGAVEVGVPQGSGVCKTLGLAYSPSYQETPTYVDKLGIYGKPVYSGTTFQLYSDFTTDPDTIGGNVVNHPSRWGHNTFYAFGVMRFVEELKQRVNNLGSLRVALTGTFTVTAAAATPQKVVGIPSITIKMRAAGTLRVVIQLSYSIDTANIPQINLYLDSGNIDGSYLPATTFGKQLIVSERLVPAGIHTFELYATRAVATDTYVIGRSGTSTDMTVSIIN